MRTLHAPRVRISWTGAAFPLLAGLFLGIVSSCGAGPRPSAPMASAPVTAPEARARACQARIEADPADLAAQTCYRQALIRLGRREEVIARATAERALRPDDPRTWYLEGLARLESAPADARKRLDECVERFPHDGLCALGVAELLLHEDDAASAMMYVERAKSGGAPPSLRAPMEARVLAALDQVDRAAVAARQAVAADSGSAAAQLALADVQLAAGQPEEALAAVDRAAALAPDDPEAPFTRGRVRLLLSDTTGAIGAFTAALAADDQFHPARRALAQALRAAGRPEAAAQHLEWLVQRFPDDPATLDELGDALLDTGQPGRALGFATLALSHHPDDLDALAVRARALIGVGQVDEALALRPKLYADPNHAGDRRVAIAEALAKSGRPELAEAEFAEATRADPAAEPVWRNYAAWLLSDGHVDRAVAVLQQGIEALPRAPLLEYDLANALERGGDRDGARAAMQKAATLDPQDPDYEDELARLEFLSGQVEAAMARWQHLVDRSPRADRARVRLSLACRLLGQHARAVSLLQDVATRHPEDPELLQRLGEALLLDGQKKAAVPVLQRALERGAEEKTVRPLLAAAQADTGDLDAAQGNFERSLGMDPGNRALRLTYARFLEARGDGKAAQAQYEALLSRDPDDSAAVEALRKLAGNADADKSRVRRAASGDAELAALAAKAPTGPEASGALGVVLRDEREVDVDAHGVATVRLVRSVLVEQPAGADRYADVSVSFHDGRPPKVLRARTLTPDGREIPVPPTKMQILDPHEEGPLYGDTRRLVLHFEGVEPGAILDYAVDVPRPQSEALGAWWDAYVLGNVDPTVRVRYTLSIPENVPYNVAAPGLPEPVREVANGRVRLTWTRTDLPAFDLGATVDPAKGPVPSVYVSGLPTWPDVDRWYNALFAPAATPDARVRERAQQVVTGAATRRDRIAAVYAYVERNVRYLGLELGIDAYRPRDAALTLTRGIGDCKDMTALMVAMLSAVGIEAYPALVRPWDQGPFIDTHPSPGQFSHVLLYVPDPEGDLWLDATSGMGTMGAIPDVIREREAFLVDGHGGRMVRIPAGDPDDSRLDETLTYTLVPTGGGEVRSEIRVTGDIAGELRQRILTLDDEARRSLLSAPGYLLGGVRSPSAVDVRNLDKPREPLIVDARLKHPDLVGVRLDGSLVMPFTVDLVGRGPLPVLREGHHVASPRTYVRHLRLEVPPGYRFTWKPLGYEQSNDMVDIRVHETREARAAVIETRLVVKRPTRTADAALAIEAALSQAAQSLNAASLVMAPGPDFNPVALLQALTQERPGEARLWTLLGRALLERSRAQEAVEALRTAWQLTPDDAEVGTLLGTAQVTAGQFAAASDTLAELARRPSAPRDVFVTLAALHLRAARPDQALATLRDGVARRPDDVELGRRLILALAASGRDEEALVEAHRQAERHPDDARAQAELADLASARGDTEAAERAYRMALMHSPEDARLINNLAWALRSAPSRRPEALDLARRAVKLDPRMPAAWDTLAELLFLTGDAHGALAANDRALALSPADRAQYEAHRRRYEAGPPAPLSEDGLSRDDGPAASPPAPAATP